MFIETKKLSLSIMLCLCLLAGLATPTLAQAGGGLITFAALGKPEIRLVGPFDTAAITFGVPSSWQIRSDAELRLNITTAFNSSDPQTTPTSTGGTLTVTLNRNTVTTLSLDQMETRQYALKIPAAYLKSARADGMQELRFALDSGLSCFANQHMTVLIGADSQLALNYTEVQPDTSLASFPRPLYERSILPDSALVVIPDEPTAAELQGAFTVAAGLGNQTGQALALDLVRASDLTADQVAASNLIFVGKAASLPQLSDLTLPLPVGSGGFTLSDPDLGAVQMVASPWSKARAALLVSGNTDAGVVKAAQAVSSGHFVTSTAPNLAIVSEVRSTVPLPTTVSDLTLADLGQGARRMESRGVSSAFYTFTVPAGSTVASDAFFDLTYGHSALLNYDLSGLIVLLNGEPIGSVRFSETTAAQAVNTVHLNIPQTLVLPGRNSLEVRANLAPLDNCINPNLRGLWTVIWPESRLHLPYVPTNTSTALGFDLGNYPAPMTLNGNLADTAFVVSRAAPETWRSGLQIAAFLGDRAGTDLAQLRVFFDDELDPGQLGAYHLIVLGQPSQLAIVGQMSQAMPVPFQQNSDVALDQFSQVTYQAPEGTPAAYLELFRSPWNTEKVVITALGSNPTAQQWAAASLWDPALRAQLSGNFATVNGLVLQAMDTRLSVPVLNAPAPADPAAQPAAATAPTPLPQFEINPIVQRPTWILPVLVAAAAAALLLLGAVALRSRRMV